MSLDDDDNPSLAPPPPTSSNLPPDAAAVAAADDLTVEDLIEDEGAASQDFRAFAASLLPQQHKQQKQKQQQQQQYRKTPGVSAQTIRKGEKDFESHGTRAQADALEQSRNAMRDVLSYTRVHGGGGKGGVVRGWYFPGWWEGYQEEEDAGEVSGEEGKERKPFGFVRERVVVLEGSSVASQALGRAVTGQAKDRPARGKDWLLPEEALYLVERGSLDLWWPVKELEEIFPPEGTALVKEGGEEAEETDEYDLGFPLSLQAAYALLIGNDGERGKISLQKFQVYSNLKRCGYNVLRAPPTPKHPPTAPSPPATTTLWQWLTSLLTTTPHQPPYGPLVQPGLYRGYASIYRQLALLPRHIPSPLPYSSLSPPPNTPFTIHYHIWKSAQKWTKLRHPPPDFYLTVVDAQDTSVPTLAEILPLLDATPPAPGKPEWTGPGRLYARLKHGYRNVLVAVVDHGVINYMRFAEGTFGGEEVFGRFDRMRNGGGGYGKGGKKSGGRGSNGRGGRGGGRGGRGRGR
jgi:tRNA-splicing endonuclease subunit Sen54